MKKNKNMLEVYIPENEQKKETIEKRLTQQFISSEVPNYSQTQIIGGSNVLVPPFSLDDWASAPEISTRLSSCIFIRSRNTAGLGYTLVPKEKYLRKIEKTKSGMTEEEKKVIEVLQKEIEKEKELVEDFLDSPNPAKSFSRILTSVIADQEAIGNGYLEVKRSLVPKDKRKPIYLNRVVGHTVRIRADGMGYVQKLDNGTFKYYKNWDDDRVVDYSNGKEAKGLLIPEKHATELIHFNIDSFRDTAYGVPRYLSCGPCIAGNRFASERNAAFFENDATPRMAIIVQGNYRLSKQSQEDIKEFLSRKAKGSDNSGRIMVIQAASKEGGLEQENVKIQFEKLTIGTTEDAAFLKYQEKNDREISEAFNLHPVFFEKDASRASANVGRSITNEQTLEPDIVDYEYLLNNTIIKAFGVEHIKIKLNRPMPVDSETKATIIQRLIRSGGITPNDIREFLGKPRFTEVWADYPLTLALQQLKVPESRVLGSPLIPALLGNINNNKIEEETDIEDKMEKFDIVKSLVHLDTLIEKAIEEKHK
jgi:PBSX family phage portal protein